MAAVVAVMLAIAVLLAGCSDGEGSLLLPGFAKSRSEVDKVSLLGPGRKNLVTLEKIQGHWTVRERAGWRADEARVEALLEELAQARIVERKTAKPELYPRIGVDDIAAADAGGLALSWQMAGEDVELIVGDPGPGLNVRHVRRSGETQALLVDRALVLEPDALAWLDHRLIDLPMPRIRQASVQPRNGTPFLVEADDSGFSVAGLPLADSDRDACAALAGFLDRLGFEDVVKAEGLPAAPAADADMHVDFLSVNGMVVSVQAWRDQARYWIAISAILDEKTARQWLEASAPGTADQGLATLRDQVQSLQSRMQGHRFMLSIDKAAVLIKTRPQYLVAP